ncbi:Hypothetical protein HVR_LOCUS1230 [uncultured virus]|nr:Hypothetical protein HVR_LOCUS1230 [uncultured virus]
MSWPFTLYVGGVIVVLIAVIVLVLLWMFNRKDQNLSNTNSSITDEFATIHAHCHKDTSCGGDLTCDVTCHRCKKQVGGDCSGDVDCQTGLHCHNWKCTDPSHNLDFPKNSPIDNDNKDKLQSHTNSSNSKRKVHWKDVPS